MRARANEETGAWVKEEEEKGRGENIPSMAVPGSLTSVLLVTTIDFTF